MVFALPALPPPAEVIVEKTESAPCPASVVGGLPAVPPAPTVIGKAATDTGIFAGAAKGLAG